MALSPMDPISWKFVGHPYDLNSVLTPDQVWAMLDLPPEEVRTALNSLITALNSKTDGASGGDSLGMTSITGLTGENPQAIIEDLVSKVLLKANTTAFTPTGDYHPATKKYVDDVAAAFVLGTISANSLTESMMAAEMKKQAGGVAEYDTLADHISDYMEHGITGTTDSSGTDTAYTLTPSPALSEYGIGLPVTLFFDKTNGGAFTVNISGLGAKSWKKHDGTDYIANEITTDTPYTAVYNGTSFLADSSDVLFDSFGDGSDGAFSSTGNVTLTSTLNGAPIIKQYTSFDLNAGHTLTVSNPCQGLIIFVNGDVTIDGTIDMSKKAGIGLSTYPPFPMIKQNAAGTLKHNKYNQLPGSIFDLLKGGSGGNGGSGGGYSGGTGTGGQGRILAGGFGGGGAGSGTVYYSGGVNNYIYGGAGGYITNPDICTTSMAGGFQSGSYGQYTYMAASTNGHGGCAANEYSAVHNGGGCYGGGGGGAGITLSAASQSGGVGSNGEYAGGFICIIARSITIGSTGLVKANGGNGGNGYGSTGGGGGGAGGGVVALFYRDSYTNGGSITVNGGTGGTGANSGTSGSVGAIHTQQL